MRTTATHAQHKTHVGTDHTGRSGKQKEVARRLASNHEGDQQRAAQQIEAIIAKMADGGAVETSQIVQTIKVWCAGDDGQSQQENQIQDVLRLVKKILAIRPPRVHLGSIMEACEDRREPQEGARYMPYAIRYATMMAFAGEESMEELARITAAIEQPAGQEPGTSERRGDRRSTEERKRARKSNESQQKDKSQRGKEEDDKRDQEAPRGALAQPSAPCKAVTFHMQCPQIDTIKIKVPANQESTAFYIWGSAQQALEDIKRKHNLANPEQCSLQQICIQVQ
jgi:hypothetical protein